MGDVGDGVHGTKGNAGIHSSLGTPSCAILVVTIALAISAGLVAQWSEEEDQQHQQAISIPLETYAQGCVKGVEEGLEVKLSL